MTPARPQFDVLERELLRGGVSPVYVRRTLLELAEHCADLEQDALARGLPADEAVDAALAALGSEQAIADAVLARPQLKDWAHRWPQAASCARSVAYVVLLPATPVLFCVCRGPLIVRWGVSAALGMLLTSALFLTLHLLILGLL